MRRRVEKAEEERRKSKRIPVGDTTFTIKTLEFGIKRKIAGFFKEDLAQGNIVIIQYLFLDL